MYIGIKNKPKNVSRIYVGIDNKPYKISKGYVGVNGKPKLIYNTLEEIVEPTPKSLTYNGTNQELINVGSDNLLYSLNNTDWSFSIPTGQNAGTYTVYYKTAKQSVSSSISVTINKAPSYYSSTPSAISSLNYNGSYQQLISPGSTPCGTIYYKLNSGSYSTSIPTAYNAGTYTVYYKIVGNSNYYDSSESYINLYISKVYPNITTYPTARSNIYENSSDYMVNSGYCSGGTMYYAVSTSTSAPSSGWSASIPTAYDRSYGTYYVHYKVIGDSNHYDSSASYITVQILKSTYTISWTSALAKKGDYLGFIPTEGESYSNESGNKNIYGDTTIYDPFDSSGSFDIKIGESIYFNLIAGGSSTNSYIKLYEKSTGNVLDTQSNSKRKAICYKYTPTSDIILTYKSDTVTSDGRLNYHHWQIYVERPVADAPTFTPGTG